MSPQGLECGASAVGQAHPLDYSGAWCLPKPDGGLHSLTQHCWAEVAGQMQATHHLAAACRQNMVEARAARLVLVHWQHAHLAKVWARWQQYMDRRRQLFGRILALATKWDRPLLQDAWEAWQAHVASNRDVKVRVGCSRSSHLLQGLAGLCYQQPGGEGQGGGQVLSVTVIG